MAGLAVLEALTEQLYDFIQSMEDDGIVDYHFKDCYSMKEANGPFLFIELLPTYISDSETTLEEMTTELDQPLVDFKHLEQLCIKLKGGTSCRTTWLMHFPVLGRLCLIMANNTHHTSYNYLDSLCSIWCCSIGACRVSTSCGELRRAAIARNKDNCLLRLEVMKGDFFILQNKLEAFLELERRIVTNDYQGC
ncbi:hypothetical protein SADUNF_Sadunf10G0183800 [Salix dunnii]|uniref:Histidine-containing phosphotransfer protein n=1 Tax=Salix dunnii TaxID=1413687 RepID=A0A835MQA6_9ROSI|nr:hypothetical protein SADUNF_Sadunf10G0183800 [Salix dunnii]